MAYVRRDGVALYYEVHGEGPVLILSHGYSATSAMWQGQIEILARRHRLILWDMRGHGRSDSPGDPAAYSEDATVEDMAAILDAVGARTAVVGGLSLGGYMSLAFHLRHPSRVDGLVLISTGPGFRNDAARAEWNAYASATADGFERSGLARLDGEDPGMGARHHRDAAGLALAARGMLAQRDAGVIDSLPDIKVPSLVVIGANDTPFLAGSKYMAAKMTNARLVVIPDAGHLSNLDQPAAVNAAIEGFLALLRAHALHAPAIGRQTG